MSDIQAIQANEDDCRFCKKPDGRRVMVEGKYGFAAYDRHPASDGHFLVIPHRHFASYFDINDDEREDLWSIVAEAKKMVDKEFKPDGYNIGINVGEWAGQSIHHLHIHVIPRYKGDVENPRGGVRGVIPAKKLYNVAPD